MIGFIVALPFIFIVGLPLALLHLRFAAPRWWSTAILGGLLSTAATSIVFRPPPYQDVETMLVFAACGVSAGLGAWLVWDRTGGGSISLRRKRDD
ncbi:hypothetical protein [Parvularcula maris]|uniref:Uncharacterized protein n=1 Tax=Parvularcula maris TaxID=2965077 RepID=A0A9X2L944_9PROT|nr:hypothetical protein [Parvularcula maris]MCQ8185307.1 hypothetical protein [Parvularcula maris]